MKFKKIAHRIKKPISLQQIGVYMDVKDKPKYENKNKKDIVFSLKIKNGLLRSYNQKLKDRLAEMCLELNYLKRMQMMRKR